MPHALCISTLCYIVKLKILEKLFIENKTSPLFKNPEKDFHMCKSYRFFVNPFF